MAKVKKILINCPNPSDGTSLYRGLGPWGSLQKERDDIEIIVGGPNEEAYDWHTFRRMDLLFMQRPFTEPHVRIIKRAKQCGVPVWIDYDDHLLALPRDNPMYRLYSDKRAQVSMLRAYELADIFTASTQGVAEMFSMERKGIVIPNAIDFDLFGWPGGNPEKKKKILWRGSPTHTRDLREVEPDIAACMKAHPDWEWHFVGIDPNEILYNLPAKVTYTEFLPLLDYFEFLEKSDHAIQIVPLSDHSFNRAKSNIGWIEASYAGAVTLAPGFSEWERPGCVTYVQGYFENALEAMLCDPSGVKNAAATSWDYILHNLSLLRVNKKRNELLEQCLRI